MHHVYLPMPSLPRILTVDPTWAVARIVRGTLDLMDRPAIQLDVPNGAEALEELKRGGVRLVVTAWNLASDMQGLELALRVKQASVDTQVVVVGAPEDPESLDEETTAESPFIYIHRPLDGQLFVRVMRAGLKGESVFEAVKPPASDAPTVLDYGPIPPLDVGAARNVIKRMLMDVGAMALILITRSGDVLLEDGAPGYLNRDKLTGAIMPMVTANVEMSGLIGGQPQAIQFYDGDDKDVFVFSVGYHHFLCAVFDGQAGGRQFGVVNRYGRQAVTDLLGLLAGQAYVIKKPTVVAMRMTSEIPVRGKRRGSGLTTTSTFMTLQPTDLEKTPPSPSFAATSTAPVALRPEAQAAESAPAKMEPIQNLDMSIFDQLGSLDSAAADDLFDMDNLAGMLGNASGRKDVTFEEAMELGVLPNLDNDIKK